MAPTASFLRSDSRLLRSQNSRAGSLPAAPAVIATAFFLFFAAALGGSSRYDALQMAILLPVACLAAAYGLIKAWDADWGELRTPLVLLMVWTGLILLQLVPLPPQVWQSLQGREPMAAVAEVLGDDKWRPLSMAPWRTQYALCAMAMPLAGLFLFVSMRDRAVSFVIKGTILVATASALLGIVQVGLPTDNFLYTYARTSVGGPVGLFANVNHASMLNAIMLIVIAATASLAPRPMPAWHLPGLGASFFILLVTQFTNGSRAGLGMTLVALLVSGAIALQRDRTASAKTQATGIKRVLASRERLIALLLFGVALLLAALFYWANKLPGIEQLMQEDAMNDLRFRIAPTLQSMVWTYLPFGSGIGSFENVYYIHEPSQALRPQYLNQAHNDVLQLLIEGGLASLAIVLAAAVWLGSILRKLFRGTARDRQLALAAAGGAVALLMGSAVDYPLRVTLFQVIVLWLVCVLAVLATRGRTSASGDAQA